MKIFISQKMRGKTKEEIVRERSTIKGRFDYELNKEFGSVDPITPIFIESYKPELAFKDPITSLAQSLAMLAEADIVLVPKVVINNYLSCGGLDMEMWKSLRIPVSKYYPEHIQILKGCEFEFLIAKSYGKKVYTYDDSYNFEEV